ncbi:DUF2953 domain-containing protein [Bacillus alveayuensis]|jgi:hypothetical protein|uniref:DUF2953 domain-containing protein n=1 Tax=Aeribacillus alveayuensis TaxID=279215 RepID=UPI000698E882|nr:DUF2953 domain-containing protein [Bacillus alveayuensis]
MNWMAWSLILLLLFFLILLCTKVTIVFDIYHDGDHDHYRIKFKTFFGLLKYSIDIPFVKVDKQKAQIIMKENKRKGKKTNFEQKKMKKITIQDIFDSLHNFKEIARHVVGLQKIIQRFFKHVNICSLEWHTYVGVGDAAKTGVVTGVAWSIKGLVLQLLTRYMKVKNHPHISITPDFQQPTSKITFNCMIYFRLGYAILTGLRFVKYWIGGKPVLRKTTSPLFIKNKNNDQSA